MKHIVHIDENNYIIGLELSLSEEAIELPEEVFNSNAVNCYKYENGEFTFDQAKLDRINLASQNEQAVNDLKRKLSDTDYVVIKIAEGCATADEYADIIESRKAWREAINELEV